MRQCRQDTKKEKKKNRNVAIEALLSNFENTLADQAMEEAFLRRLGFKLISARLVMHFADVSRSLLGEHLADA